MVDVVVPADPSAQGAPSFTHNLFMNAISSGSLQSVIQHINHEPDLVNEFGKYRSSHFVTTGFFTRVFVFSYP